MIPRAGRDLIAPPLARDLIRHQPRIYRGANAARRKKHQAGRGVTSRRALFRLDERNIGRRCQPEETRQLGHDFAGFIAVSLRHRFRLSQIERRSGALRGNPLRLAFHQRNVTREARRLRLEAPYVSRLRVDAIRQHAELRRRGDLEIHRVAIGRVTVDREPTSRIHQKRVVVLDGREPDAVNRRLFLAGQHALINEAQRGRRVLRQRLRQRYGHLEFVGPFRDAQARAALVGGFFHRKGVIEIKRDG